MYTHIPICAQSRRTAYILPWSVERKGQKLELSDFRHEVTPRKKQFIYHITMHTGQNLSSNADYRALYCSLLYSQSPNMGNVTLIRPAFPKYVYINVTIVILLVAVERDRVMI